MSPTQPTNSDFRPAYLDSLESGELERRVETAYRRLQDCDLCARYCRVDRLEALKGAVCRTGELARIHSAGPHHGEEDPLRGRNGSGTIFFSWCNLRCDFCQNWKISQTCEKPSSPCSIAASSKGASSRTSPIALGASPGWRGMPNLS